MLRSGSDSVMRSSITTSMEMMLIQPEQLSNPKPSQNNLKNRKRKKKKKEEKKKEEQEEEEEEKRVWAFSTHLCYFHSIFPIDENQNINK